jgi:pimeloyl-ACP methyl ester carboxylesterase
VVALHMHPSPLPKGETFTFEECSLHFHRWEGGPNYLLAFHGFGQQASDFVRLADALKARYTLIGIDLFYHGKSQWPRAEQALTQAYWQRILTAFLEELRIERFSLAGFSLGGKLVLASLQAFPERIEELYFIAPDGIKTSFWYSLATYPGWARRYFRYLVQHPGSFFQLTEILHKLNLLDRGILRFAKNQMGTPDKRQRVYNSWVVYSRLRFQMPHLAELIKRHKIQVHMFLGKYDKIMTLHNMNKLLKHLDDYKLTILKAGHNTLIEDTARYLDQDADTAGSR